MLRAAVREAAGERAEWPSAAVLNAEGGLDVAAALQQGAEPGALQRGAELETVQQAVLEAVQRAPVLGTVLRAAESGAVQRAAEPGAAANRVVPLEAAARRAVLCGAVLQSAGGGNPEVGQAGQLVLTGSFSSFFSKNISLFKKILFQKISQVHKRFCRSGLGVFSTQKKIQVIVRAPPSQRPKKAQHVQDLKAP